MAASNQWASGQAGEGCSREYARDDSTRARPLWLVGVVVIVVGVVVVVMMVVVVVVVSPLSAVRRGGRSEATVSSPPTAPQDCPTGPLPSSAAPLTRRLQAPAYLRGPGPRRRHGSRGHKWQCVCVNSCADLA